MATATKIDLADWLGGEIHEEYSGRGMLKKTCIGFEYETEHEAIVDMMSALSEAGDDADDLFRALKGYAIDSLGLGVILYFPRFSRG